MRIDQIDYKLTTLHTESLNYIYSLFRPQSNPYSFFSDNNYIGKPDPRIGEFNPDFISYEKIQGDVQIIDSKMFFNESSKTYLSDCEKVLEHIFETYKKYQNITLLNIIEYFAKFSEKIYPKYIEIVIVLPKEIYNICQENIRNVNYPNTIFWIFDNMDKPYKLVLGGNHRNSILNNYIINLPPLCPNLILLFRNSNFKFIKLHFSTILLNYCARNWKVDFDFAEIDDIMTEKDYPLLGHLPLTDRIEFWKRCLRFLASKRIIEMSSKSPNSYRWRRDIRHNSFIRASVLNDISAKVEV